MITVKSVEEIVLVLDNQGKKLGTMSFRSAKNIAENEGLDIIPINQQGNMVVCKIMDEGKWKYEKKKSEKKQAVHHLKEIKFNLNTEQHDVDIKLNHIKEFLGKGDDVLIMLSLRGREKGKVDLASQKLNNILSSLDGMIKTDGIKKSEGSLSVLVHPVKM